MLSNPNAERAVVGACIVSPEATGRALEILSPEDFESIPLMMAFKICRTLFMSDEPKDIISFITEAKKQGVYEYLGGQPFIAEVIDEITTTANVAYHAELVKESAIRRRLVDVGAQISALAAKDSGTMAELVAEAEKLFIDTSCAKTSYVSSDKAAPEILAKLREPKTCFAIRLGDVKNIMPGFRPGSLNILAARPSMGKTALALNIAQFGGNPDDKILFFSLEMSVEQLIHRMLSAQTKIPLSAISSGRVTDGQYEILQNTRLRNIDFYPDSGLSATEFKSRCRRYKMRNPNLALIVVDYLQLMTAEGKYGANRVYEVAEISRCLKATAMELECPVLALSQLSRAPEQRPDKKPQLSDLRDSGAIEQDADVVMLLYRDDYYGENENNDLTYSTAELRIAKNRTGSTGVCKLIFQREFTNFTGLAR